MKYSLMRQFVIENFNYGRKPPKPSQTAIKKKKTTTTTTTKERDVINEKSYGESLLGHAIVQFSK